MPIEVGINVEDVFSNQLGVTVLELLGRRDYHIFVRSLDFDDEVTCRVLRLYILEFIYLLLLMRPCLL